MTMTVKSLYVEKQGTFAYPRRMVRATIASEGGAPDMDVWTLEPAFELALGAALPVALEVAALAVTKMGGYDFITRIDVKVPSGSAAAQGRRRAAVAPPVRGAPLIEGLVDQINFENKGTFLGEEIVAAAFVRAGDERLQLFADDLAHVAALLTSMTARRELAIAYDVLGAIKVVREVAYLTPKRSAGSRRARRA